MKSISLLLLIALLSASVPVFGRNFGLPGQLPAVHICSNKTMDGYHLGRAIGEVFEPQIRQFFEDNLTLRQKLLPFVATEEGKKIYNVFLENNSKLFKNYIDELHGMADGSGLLFEELFTQALSPELNLILRKAGRDIPLDEACSDVMIKDGDTIMMGHNEDGSDFAERAFFVHACQPHPDREKLFRMASYVYPGNLMGNAMGYNSFGIVVTTNELFPKDIIYGQAMRYMLNRDLLNTASIEDGINRATRYGCASGFNVNIGSVFEKRIVTIEVGPSSSSPSDTYNVMEVKGGSYCHFNAFLRTNVTAFYDNSSVHRLARANEIGPVADGDGIRRILSDQKDPDWPIYRTERPPDYDKTLATGVFDLAKGSVAIYRSKSDESLPVALYDLLVIGRDVS